MLFRRRNANFFDRFWAFIWPRKGFIRGWLYLLMRILRLRSSDYSLAAGFAVGIAVSFTPLIGLHILLAIALAWLVRGNIIMAMIGTAAGNPWTFPLIWVLIYTAGNYILGIAPDSADVTMLSYELLLQSPGQVLISMLAGGALIGGILGVISFIIVYLFAGQIKRGLLKIKRQRVRRMIMARAKNDKS